MPSKIAKPQHWRKQVQISMPAETSTMLDELAKIASEKAASKYHFRHLHLFKPNRSEVVCDLIRAAHRAAMATPKPAANGDGN